MKYRLVALIVVSFLSAWLLKEGDAVTLKRINSMPPVEYVEHVRHIHQHSYFLHFITALLLGALFLLVIEFLAFVFRSYVDTRATPTA